MATKTFTAGSVLTAADTNTYLANAGLVFVKSQSLTTVTNSITDCFSSTYDSYRVIINNFNNATTTSRQVLFRFGTDNSANYAWGHQYFYGAGTNAVAATTGVTAMELCYISQRAGQSVSMDIHNPNLATNSNLVYQAVTYQSDISAIIYRQGFANINTTTQYTGFQIIGNTDNLSGTVTVYGYRKA